MAAATDEQMEFENFKDMNDVTDKKKRKHKKKNLSPEEKRLCQTPLERQRQTPVEALEPKKKKKKKNKNEEPVITYDMDLLFSNNGKRPGGSYLSFHDIRTLIMLTVHGETYPCLPTWCRVNAWQKIMKTVVVMVGCVSEEDYRENKECFSFLNAEFPKPVPVRNEGNDVLVKSPLESFLRYKMPKKLQLIKNAELESDENKKIDAYKYILNENQLRANEFPEWNSSAREHGVVTTRQNGRLTVATKHSKLLAIDCEMCNVQGNERALTRISVVDSHLETVYDKLVKPKEPIIDYLTEFSGITAKLLENVKTTLEDVQRDLLNIIEPDTILVGHSLDFDLRAIKLHHDNIIDTSVLFVDHRGPRYKSSLKFLVKTYLKRDIQNSSDGHCSIEDAKSCMELVLLKLQNGARFGIPESDSESVFEALSRSEKRGALIDTANIARQHCYGNNHSIPCTSDEQVVSGCERWVKDADFVFAHLKEYENIVKGIDEVTEKRRESAFRKLDQSVSKIVANVTSQTLVLVSFSSGYITADIMKMVRDKEQKKSDVVKDAVKKARNGLTFLKIT